MTTDVETRLRALITQIAERETVALGPDDDLVEGLGLDSLQGLQVLAGVEKRFGVRLPDDQLASLRTIRRIVQAIERGTAGGGS